MWKVRTQDRRHAWSRYLTTPATGMIVIHLSGRRSRYVKQFVYTRAHVYTNCVFFLFSLLLLLLSPPSLPPPSSLPYPPFTPLTVGLSPVIVVDIFINIYDNVAIFTFTTSFVWLKCFVHMIYVPGNIYPYLCFASVSPTCKKTCYLCISLFSHLL